MKKISIEEANSLRLRYKKQSPLRVELLAMKKGELLQIEPSDCGNKRGPSEMCSRLNKKMKRTHNYLCRKIVSKGIAGWVVERLK